MFSMYVGVDSTTVDPDRITSATGIEPDEVWWVGDRRHGSAPPRQFNSWKKYARSSKPDAHTEELAEIILSWGQRVPEELGKICRSSDATAALVLIQDIDNLDDPMQQGIELSVDLIKWLATAEASVSIDQYLGS